MKKILLLLALSSSLLAEMNVLIFAGSTRTNSYNKQLAQEAAEVVRGLGAKATVIDLKNYAMPLFDADLEQKGVPKNAKKLHDLMVASDAIVIASPEYNASVSAVLKNALDWTSRDGKAFKGKTFALLSASPGRLGGARGLMHLREIVEEAGGTVVKTQVVVPHAHEVFKGDLSPLRHRLQELLEPLIN